MCSIFNRIAQPSLAPDERVNADVMEPEMNEAVPAMQKRFMRKAKKYLSIPVFFGVLIFCLSIFSCNTPSAMITDSSGDRELAFLLEKMRIKANQTALAAAIISEGKVLAAAAVGTRKNGTKNWVTVDDRFLIASCGKAFTSALAALMVEEEKINWDTTIRDVFPGLKMRTEYESINIEQLLSHRAGLPKNFIADLNPRQNYSPTAGRLVYLSQLVQTKLSHSPGSSMLYSNAGYIVAGVILETVSGQEFTDLMSKKIFKPLGLSTAGYGPPAATDPTSQPWGHIWDKSKRSLKAVQTDDPHWIDPAGNVCLSIKDWARFMIEHLPSDGSKSNNLLKPVSLKKLHTPPNTANWAYDRDYFNFWEKGMGWQLPSANYALGWYVTKGKTEKVTLNHAGTSRAFQAEIYLSPKNKSAILVATNARMGHIHLYKTVTKINNKYALNIDLPSN